jgi:outer membrane lipoprotein-sorting protein
VCLSGDRDTGKGNKQVKTRVLAIAVVVVALVVVALVGAGLVSAAFSPAPTPQDILTRAATTLQAVNDGHAVLNIAGNTSDKSGSATIEVWGKKLAGGDNPSYAFRAEVRQVSPGFDQAQGAIAVSDGATVWIYLPGQNTVWTGSLASAEAQMRQMHGAAGATPLDPQALVQQLLSYATATLSGTETVQGHTAYKLQLTPSSDKTPAALAGATGLLWVDTARWLPLQASVNAGSFGQGTVTATLLEVNAGVADSLFQFQPPQGARVVPIQSQQPQNLSLGDAAKALGGQLLQPSSLPAGATLVDVLKVGQTVVLRYQTPQGSFAIAQGAQAQAGDKAGAQIALGEPVTVRGVTGKVIAGKTGNEVLLTWTENGRSYSVSGALSTDQALQIAASLQ